MSITFIISFQLFGYSGLQSMFVFQINAIMEGGAGLTEFLRTLSSCLAQTQKYSVIFISNIDIHVCTYICA